jgi:hypothetical protein
MKANGPAQESENLLYNCTTVKFINLAATVNQE